MQWPSDSSLCHLRCDLCERPALLLTSRVECLRFCFRMFEKRAFWNSSIYREGRRRVERAGSSSCACRNTSPPPSTHRLTHTRATKTLPFLLLPIRITTTAHKSVPKLVGATEMPTISFQRHCNALNVSSSQAPEVITRSRIARRCLCAFELLSRRSCGTRSSAREHCGRHLRTSAPRTYTRCAQPEQHDVSHVWFGATEPILP